MFRNQFDAQYGAALAAVVTVVTRSGTNDLARHRLLLRPRRLVQRPQRLPAVEAGLRAAAHRRLAGRPDLPATGPTSSAPTSTTTSPTRRSSPCRRATRSPPARTASSRPAAASTCSSPSGTTASPTTTRRSCATPSTTSGRRAPATPARTAPTSTTRRRCTALIGEQSWVLSNTTVNTLRGHYMWNEVATLPVSFGARRSAPVGDHRPELHRAAVLPAHPAAALRDAVHDRAAATTSRWAATTPTPSTPTTRTSTRAASGSSAPTRRSTRRTRRPGRSPSCMQTTGVYDYNSHILAAYLQDDWRVSDKLTLNLGLRYDLDTNLRMNDVYEQALQDPQYAGLDNFVSADRGNDYNNLQPRLGVTYDITRRGHAGRPRRLGHVRHPAPPLLRPHRPGPPARHRGAHREPRPAAPLPEHRRRARPASPWPTTCRAAPRARSTSSPTTTCCPQSQNTTAGIGWQINGTTGLDVDFVHAYGYNQLGAFDLNLPAVGPRQRPQPAAGAPVHRGQEPRELLQELVRRARDPAADAAARARQPAGLLHAVAQLPRRRQPLPDLPGHDAHAAGGGLQRHGHAPQPVGGRLDDRCRGTSSSAASCAR